MRAYAESGKKAIADRKSYLKRNYGITVEQYDEMLATPCGGCAICGRLPRDDIALHVDHDHATGEVRGLLCFPCNNALGLLQEDAALFAAARRYLEAFDTRVNEEVERARRRARELVGTH